MNALGVSLYLTALIIAGSAVVREAKNRRRVAAERSAASGPAPYAAALL